MIAHECWSATALSQWNSLRPAQERTWGHQQAWATYSPKSQQDISSPALSKVVLLEGARASKLLRGPVYTHTFHIATSHGVVDIHTVGL